MDEKNSRFGTHCLMIKDNEYFFKKIQLELKKNGYKFDHGFINYYDKSTVSKMLTPFDKPNDFEYQKEFRFYVQNYKLEPIKIQIGSLMGYSEMIETKHLTELRIERKIR